MEHLPKYKLEITADGFMSDNPDFSKSNIFAGDNYKPVDVYFVSGQDNQEIRRQYRKYERKMTNQTLPRLTFQIFEDQLLSLSHEELLDFPVCSYNGQEVDYRGIFFSIEEFREYRNTIEYVRYVTKGGRELFFYCWNIFTTLVFVQECLKRFGEDGDKFVLEYREKDKNESDENDIPFDPNLKVGSNLGNFTSSGESYKNKFSQRLIDSKNIIFRGAPGTGKSYLAKQLAADIVTQGRKQDYEQLTPDELEQIEFVQFHPSFDYSDFVEGLRPRIDDNGTMGFSLQDGVFKKFVAKAKKNYVDSKKSQDEVISANKADRYIEKYISSTDFESHEIHTVRNTFNILDFGDEKIEINIPNNSIHNQISLRVEDIKSLLSSNQNFSNVIDVVNFFNRGVQRQTDSYLLAIYKDIKNIVPFEESSVPQTVGRKNYVFIIDEINRGEISKIFGELFFSIDPGYRGPRGGVSTQYSNLHSSSEGLFYIPENVYIVGTMNDIDRSVDSFDFAMRRRFRFIEITAEGQSGMLDCLNEEVREEAKRRLAALNEAITATDELNQNYHIGPAYMMKVDEVSFDKLWSDYLKPLLSDYVRGMFNEDEAMLAFETAYNSAVSAEIE